MSTIFLLSPARTNGERAAQLARSETAALGTKLRAGEAPLGDVFAWLSALYFRGKLAYANVFGAADAGVPGSLVMTSLGLRCATMQISVDDLQAMGRIVVESDAFARTLRRDAELVVDRIDPATRVVLLGSIATGKYLDTLLDVFGARLLFPASFVGRGDMSRGGLLLRAAKSGEPLDYAPVRGAALHGKRPPKLPRMHA